MPSRSQWVRATLHAATVIDGVVRQAEREGRMCLAELLRRVVLPQLHAAVDDLVRSRRCWRLQLDTYTPEVRRYGGADAMGAAEAIFQADSDALLDLVASRAGEPRWRAALLGLHLLLCDLVKEPSPRRSLLRGLAEAFAAEHRLDGRARKQIAQKYRAQSAELEALLSGANGQLADAREIFDRRSLAIGVPVQQLCALGRAGALTSSFESIAASLLHMHVNRMLPSSPRAHELVLYSFLLRLHERFAHES